MVIKEESIKQILGVADLAQIVRAHRKKQGLTQDVAASLSNVSTNFLSDFENGKSTAEIGKVLHTLNTLGIELYAAPRGVINNGIRLR